jgi:hypothetical protein
MSIFQAILAERSFTLITYNIENALPGATAAEKAALTRMLETNKLDEIYAIAHEQLGQHEEAAQLRQWMAERANKRTTTPELLFG